MIHCFNYIVHIDAFICNSYGVGLKDIPGLLRCKPGALYMIGVVGKLYLNLMVQTTF